MNSPLSLKKFTSLGSLPSEFHKLVEENINVSKNEKTKQNKVGQWTKSSQFFIWSSKDIWKLKQNNNYYHKNPTAHQQWGSQPWLHNRIHVGSADAPQQEAHPGLRSEVQPGHYCF